MKQRPRDRSGVVLFDGVCNLCNQSVLFMIARDPARRLRFASLQSDAAQRVLPPGVAIQSLPESLALIVRGAGAAPRVYVKSSAALRIAQRLRFPWPMLGVFLMVPPLLRDGVYDWIARNRYRWFGRRDACMAPTPDLESRFLRD